MGLDRRAGYRVEFATGSCWVVGLSLKLRRMGSVEYTGSPHNR